MKRPSITSPPSGSHDSPTITPFTTSSNEPTTNSHHTIAKSPHHDIQLGTVPLTAGVPHHTVATSSGSSVPQDMMRLPADGHSNTEVPTAESCQILSGELQLVKPLPYYT